MIFVLKGADFSANNLGQVELRTEINEFTEGIILKSGNTNMTRQQKSALDSFFRAIGAFGDSSNIWSKIDMLVMPLICSDLEHASVDYTGKHTITRLTESGYALRNHGITGVSDSPSANCATVNDVLFEKGNFSLFVMRTEDFTEAAQNSPYIVAYNGNSGSNRFYAQDRVSSDGQQQFRIDHIKPYSNIAVAVSSGRVPSLKGILQGVSIDNTGIAHCLSGNEIVTVPYNNYNAIGVDTTPVNTYLYGTPAGKAPTTSDKAIGMTIYAKYLSDTEMTTLYNAANILASYFLV